MDLHKNAASLLRAIGMLPKYKGYWFLLYILEIAVEDPLAAHNISARLYPRVCNRFGVSCAQVERNIRFAIRRTWETDATGYMHALFRNYSITYVPTNSEFIAVMTECLIFGRRENAVQISLFEESAESGTSL